jgi:hypothetical protein
MTARDPLARGVRIAAGYREAALSGHPMPPHVRRDYVEAGAYMLEDLEPADREEALRNARLCLAGGAYPQRMVHLYLLAVAAKAGHE